MNMLRNIFATLLLIGLVTASASAQGRGQTASDRTQAVLTIRLYIAPVVVSPQSQAGNAHFESISYNIPTSPVRLTVTQHTEQQLVSGANGQQQPVKVVTVVPE